MLSLYCRLWEKKCSPRQSRLPVGGTEARSRALISAVQRRNGVVYKLLLPHESNFALSWLALKAGKQTEEA